MKGAVLHGPRDVRFEEREAPKIEKPNRCGHSHLGDVRVRVRPVALSRHSAGRPADRDGARILRYRRRDGKRGQVGETRPVRHRLVLRVGQYMPQLHLRIPVLLRAREFVGTAQAPILRVPLADGTLVATPGLPSEDLIPSLLAVSDVMGTGWFAADAANVKPGATVVVVG